STASPTTDSTRPWWTTPSATTSAWSTACADRFCGTLGLRSRDERTPVHHRRAPGTRSARARTGARTLVPEPGAPGVLMGGDPRGLLLRGDPPARTGERVGAGRHARVRPVRRARGTP